MNYRIYLSRDFLRDGQDTLINFGNSKGEFLLYGYYPESFEDLQNMIENIEDGSIKSSWIFMKIEEITYYDLEKYYLLEELKDQYPEYFI